MSLIPALVNDEIESLHVHTVYDQIASHFSSTRYKVRPEQPSFGALILLPTLSRIGLADHFRIPRIVTTRLYRSGRGDGKREMPPSSC